MLSEMLLFESKDWIVLDKPSGWLTIPPTKIGEEKILSEWAAAKFGRVWIVHRIDRETSGVVLFARNEDAHRRANQWFESHEVKKTYHLIAKGAPAIPVLKIREPIAGAPSLTQVEVKETLRGSFFGIATPTTGRRHQIRIHLSKAGFPILGDVNYGGPTEFENRKIGRVALHAAKLVLPSGESFEAKWPDDFSKWIQELRK